MNLILYSNFIVNCDYIINQEVRFLSNINFSINSCYFYRNNMFSGDGGVIYCKNILSIMNLNNCLFYQCFC